MTHPRLLTLVLTVLLAGALSAQRARSTTYDTERTVTLRGPVTRVEWVNPHAFVFIDVRSAAGTVENWAIDIGAPLDLARAGWTWNDIAIGQTIAVTGVPTRAPMRQALARAVTLVPSGAPLFTASRRTQPPTAATAAPAPRGPDGHVRLGPPTGQKGYWAPVGTPVLIERTGRAVRMNDEGLLRDLADADRVAPFQPWSRSLYLHRQRTRFEDDPLARCLPPGGPRQFQMPNGVQFVEQRELGRILVLLGGGDRNWRAIYTDGRPAGQAAEAVLSFYGTSVGRWEGDTLVVDAVGFNERFWMTAGGLPHTEALHLTERFTRVDLNSLRYEVTVDDPRTYTRPWKGGWTMRWVAGQEIEEYFCEENAESTFIR